MRRWVGLGTYGLAGGLENGLAGGLLGFFCFLMIYRGGRPNVPAAVNRLTTAGKAARRRKATIYRDLYAVADAFARCGKANSSATKNVSGSSVTLLNKSYEGFMLSKWLENSPIDQKG